jgi:predicted acylesterase/phospholipase RssA
MTDADRNNGSPPVCDLIMKGGITSGVIYPKLIGKLAEAYRLKNIGGTSAGAIAAAGAAAAEFQRHTRNTDAGFAKLTELPGILGSAVQTAEGDRSRLLTLFQPVPELKRHFEILLNTLNVKVPLLATLEVAFQVLRHFPLPALAILLLSMLLPWSSFLALTGEPKAALWAALSALAGWAAITLAIRVRFRGKIAESCGLCRPFLLWFGGGVAATFATAWTFNAKAVSLPVVGMDTLAVAVEILLATMLALAGSLHAFSRSLINSLCANGFGFCNGRTSGSGPKALTDWLTGYFNELAGLDPTERPLSFGDLWRGSRNVKDPMPTAKHRVINFEAMTSAVSRKMPYRIPFTRDDKIYYFDEDEWQRLFPNSVLKAMKPDGFDESAPHPENPSRRIYRLPPAESWPVVVAVRMSLSFPILLSAVPLYAADRVEEYWDREISKSHGRTPDTKPTFKKVWFSDGGISSNMPLHFFDAFLPQHPTFAINLAEKHPKADLVKPSNSAQPGYEAWRVFLPKDNNEGRYRTWKSPTTDRVGGLLDFLWSIIGTMQNWRDELQFPYPGYRDRIVQISQSHAEGGLNLNMPAADIDALGNAGENAGNKLIEKFLQGGGWENHQRTRLRTLLTQLDIKLNDLDLGTLSIWRDLLDKKDSPYQFKNKAEKELAETTLESLVELAKTMQIHPETLAGDSAPHPFAEIRVTPKV